MLTTVLGSGIAFLDGTVINVALPTIGRELDASFAGLSWIANGYLVTLASLILVGGSVGDRLGRKRVYLAGAGAFALASLMCGMAPNVPLLVVARAFQGVAGAFLVPGSLALIQTTFHPDDRARAIGAWSGLAGITTAIGPFLGGWLVEAASWRWVFLLNLPMAAVVILVGQRHLLESRDPTIEGRPDLPGAALGALGLAASTYGLIQEDVVVGLVGLAVLATFVVVEARTAHPMLPLGIFRSRQFSGANAVTFAVYAALSAVLFLLSLVLQQALGYSPLAAGAATVPLTLVMLALSSRSGALAQRIGPRIPMTLGPLGIAAGMVLMLRIDTGGTYLAQVLPALLVFSGGLVLTVAPLTSTVLAAADARHAGVASGVNNAVSRAAGLIAVAGLPIIAGFDASAAVGGETLVDGFHRATVVGAAVVLVGAAIAWLTIRSDVLEVAAGEDAKAEEDEAAVEACFSCAVSSPPTPHRERAPMK
ncbi:MFS transporter [Iamia sp. SCSIO 61187]|uniref:MFS transporter n=1 Tax=Iamia sp. SCSIO 61187 TaxID=2722752 RepID=UPI00351D90CD|nr:MFS transporter [Iamia sp. SCSIO 61187]